MADRGQAPEVADDLVHYLEKRPEAVKLVLGLAAKRRWQHLARERL